MLILFPNKQAMLQKKNIRYQQAKLELDLEDICDSKHYEEEPKERQVGANSEDGCLSFVLSGKNLAGIRLNLECQQGEVTLLIESSEHHVAEITLSGVDETDWFWALDEHLADHAMQIDTLVASIYLRHATLYAVEVIQLQEDGTLR